VSRRSGSPGCRPVVLSALLLLLFASFAVRAAEPPSAAELYERAYFLEQGRGDLEGAIKLYRQLVSQYPENRKLAARALLRIGTCHERLGVDGAIQAYRAILEKYGDQTDVARVAEEKLRSLEKIGEVAVAELSTGVKVRQIVLRNGKAMVGYPGSLSPDGTRIAYYNWDTENFVAQELRNGTERSIPRPRVSSSPSPATGAKWSNDGKRIAFGLGGADYMAVAVGELETGTQTIWYRRSGAHVFPIHWTRDGRLVCSMSDNDTRERSLAILSGPGTEAVRYPVVGDSFRVAPDGKHVVYSFSKPESHPDIFVADLARPAEATLVAPHPAGDLDPIWSADGRHLAFRSNRAGSWDLWAIAIDQAKPVGEPFRLQKDIGEQTTLDTWRSDGQLLYNKSAVLQDIWLLPVSAGTGRATGKAYLLSQIQGGNYAPFWSPDGARIGYTATRRADRKQRLYVTRIDQFKEQEIELPCDSFYNPTWSRDGRSILMVASVKEKRTFLRYDLASGEASTFLFDHELLRKGTAFGDFSPDGRQVLFDGFGPQGELAGIHIYDGSSVKKVPGTEGARPAQWSPDGQRIAFARQGNVWLVRPDGSGLRNITNLPAGATLARLSWAPNGRFIAYTSSALFVIGVDEDFREKLPGAEGLNSGRVAWSPDGRYLALGSAQGSSELWAMENFLPKGK
jgi:Tol biopolymer transport system component